MSSPSPSIQPSSQPSTPKKSISPAHRKSVVKVASSSTNVISKSNESYEKDYNERRDSKEETYQECLSRFYWSVFKSHMFCLTMFSLMMSVVIIMGVIFIFSSGETAFVNRANIQNTRNFSALVPIWGAIQADSLGDWGTIFLLDLVAVGILYGILGLVGLVTYLGRTRLKDFHIAILLGVYVILNLAAIFTEMHLVISLNNYDNSAYRAAKAAIQEKIKNEYGLTSEGSFTQSFNLVMISGRCCGIEGPDDFSEINMTVHLTPYVTGTYKYAPRPRPSTFYWPKDGRVATLKVPPVCCKEKFFTRGTLKEQFERQIQCASKGYDESDAYVLGCGKKYHEVLLKGYGGLFTVYLTTILYLKVSVSFMCIIRLMQHFDKSVDSQKFGTVSRDPHSTKTSDGYN